MKKIIAMILCIALVTTLSVGLMGCTSREETLIVYNCDEYLDEGLNDEFEAYYKEKTGKKIVVDYSVYDVNETLMSKVIDGNGDYDVFCPSDYAADMLIEAGEVMPIDRSLITNYDNIDPTTLGLAFDEDNSHSIPYMWGTIGILYNTDFVTEAELDEHGYGILFGANDKFKGKVLMKDSIRDVIAASALYVQRDEIIAETDPIAKQQLINDSINLNVPGLLKEVETLLTNANDDDFYYGWEVDSGKDDMIAGGDTFESVTSVLNLAWSGDAAYAIYQNPKLAYYIPDEGTNIWVDAWQIHNEAANPEAAHMYIDFMLRPESASRNMDEVMYTSAVNRSVLEEAGLFDEATFGNELSYPSLEMLAKCAPMLDFGVSEQALKDFWTRVRS